MIQYDLLLQIANIIINLIDVLLVLLPILLAVAFMTIIERKQLAAHQRRVGPNTVGYKQIKNKDYFLPRSSKIIKRSYHNFSDSYKNIIKDLYQNRVAPVKLFNSKVLDTCYSLTSIEEINLFFKNFKDKGGIYLFQYKGDPNIYYIGRTKNFNSRFNIHLKTKVKDKFHLFANLVGWDQFNFSIVEICDINNQQEREKFYLQNYLPLLNTVFKSNFSQSQIYETLYRKLKAKQGNLEFKNKHGGIPIYVYNCNNLISTNFLKYNSINTLSKDINVARDTIKKYLNTHVPYNNCLFYTYVINDFNLINGLINCLFN